MYEIASAVNLQRDPRVLKSGMQKNVRFVGDGPNDAEPVLQIDPKKAAFFSPGPLGRFLEQILPGQGQLQQKIFHDKNFKMAVKQVKSKLIDPRVNGQPIVFRPCGAHHPPGPRSHLRHQRPHQGRR